MRYFLDNTLPPRFAKALGALMDDGERVVHLTSRFFPSTPDVEWIEALGREGGWIVISNDVRITRNVHERKAWQQSGLTAFFLKRAWSSQNYWLQAANLIRWWPDIMAQARKVSPGASFLVPFRYSGRFEQPRLLP